MPQAHRTSFVSRFGEALEGGKTQIGSPHFDPSSETHTFSCLHRGSSVSESFGCLHLIRLTVRSRGILTRLWTPQVWHWAWSPSIRFRATSVLVLDMWYPAFVPLTVISCFRATWRLLIWMVASCEYAGCYRPLSHVVGCVEGFMIETGGAYRVERRRPSLCA